MLSKLRAEVGIAAASGMVVDAGEFIADTGIKFLKDEINIAKVNQKFNSDLAELENGEGFLFAYAVFASPDGQEYAHGPLPFGSGKRVEEPLVNISFSDQAAASITSEMAEALQPGAGWASKEILWYWASKMPDNKIQFYRVDGRALDARRTAELIRMRSMAARSSSGIDIQKLAEQAKLFNEIETRFRDEIREADIEARLLTIRAKMRQADREFRAAKNRRARALEDLDQSKGIQQAIKLFNLAGSVSSLISSAQSRVDYETSAANNAASIYNSETNIYINVIQNNTTISPGIIPKNPNIELY